MDAATDATAADEIRLLASLVAELGTAAAIDRVSITEQVQSVAAAVQAKAAVAFDRTQRAEQAARGVPSTRQGRGVASDVALAKRVSPNRGGRWLQWAKVITTELPATYAELASGRTTLFLRLRDQTYRTPYCDAPIRHADHVRPHSGRGPTAIDNGQGLCVACKPRQTGPRLGQWSRTRRRHRHPDPRRADLSQPATRPTTPTTHASAPLRRPPRCRPPLGRRPLPGRVRQDRSMTGSRPPLPPFDAASAARKVQAAEDAWNTRDPQRVAGAYTVDSVWRNRDSFVTGREAIVRFLTAKWERELDYALRKNLWAFDGNRIGVRFQYESHDASGRWYRSYGNELWEFTDDGLMRRREASINDTPIEESERRIFGPRGDDERGVELPLQ